MKGPASYTTMFLEWKENGPSCLRCASPFTSLHLHPHSKRDWTNCWEV